MLYSFLLYNYMNQLYVYIYPLPLQPPSHPTPTFLSFNTELGVLASAIRQDKERNGIHIGKEVNIHKLHDYLVGISPLMFTLQNRTCMALFPSTPPTPLLFKDQFKCISFIKACPDAFSLKLSLLSLSFYFNANVSHSVVSDSQQSHDLQPARLLCQ